NIKNFIVAIALIGLTSCQQKQEPLVLSSPGAINEIQFSLSAQGVPTYQVSHGAIQVLNPSELGFVFKDNDSLYRNFEIVAVERRSFDKEWDQVWGEKKTIRNNYNELAVQLQEKGAKKRKLNLEFRAYDDGVAFRYIFPEQGVKDSIFIMDELTEFELAEDGKAWWIPAYDEQRYEYLFNASPVSTLDTVHTPLTIESKSGLSLSFHEANLINFASTTLAHTQGTTLKTDLVPWSDGGKVRITDSFTTPWRTLQIAKEPTELITSYLSLTRKQTTKLQDKRWIIKFQYIGIGWGMHIGKYTFWEGEKQGATTENAKKYSDFAANEGIDHLLIDGCNKGWTPDWYKNAMHQFNFTQQADDFDLEAVTDYAAKNNVRIIGYHETGSNIDNYLKQIDSAFALYNKVGIHDVKIGHVGSLLKMKEWHHGQFGVEYFRYVLEKAAEYKLTVLYH